MLEQFRQTIKPSQPNKLAESVILVYGSRPGSEHIRRNGIERGKITRFNAEGTAEEANYERRFVRGESLEKRQSSARPKAAHDGVFTGLRRRQALGSYKWRRLYSKTRRSLKFPVTTPAQHRLVVALQREWLNHHSRRQRSSKKGWTCT